MMDTKSLDSLKAGGRQVYTARPDDPDLGPLGLLPGKWTSSGRGWNMIALPFAAPGAPPFRLLLNQFNETLNFTLVDKAVPNRGITADVPPGEKDQLVVTLDYEQRIEQVAAVDSPVSGKAGVAGLAIHHEPGLWLYMTNHVDNNMDVGRLATIPHGNSVLALGTSEVLAAPDGPSLIPDVSGMPIGVRNPDINDPANRYLAPYKQFRDAPFMGNVPPGVGFPGFDPVSPAALLKQALQELPAQGLTIQQTTVLHVDSSVQSAGIVNIPFVVAQADARRMVSTFWIHELVDAKGGRKLLLQYLQDVSLDFFPRGDGVPGLIRWPHVSINTLEKMP